jgi:hypothetical protein
MAAGARDLPKWQDYFFLDKMPILDILREREEQMITATIQTYTWRVYQNNRFAGYVLAYSEREAISRATSRYGSNVRVERVPTFW